jgi:hypothetical protein
MPQITEGEKTYWLPEVLPEPTEEYKLAQSEKRYLTNLGVERRHPGWTYAENIAYVDDEYLFQNEGWKVVNDDGGPTVNPDDLNHKTRNSPDLWEDIDERNVRVTYTLTDFTQDEIDEYTERKWVNLRAQRNIFLSDTDWVITRAVEENLTVSSEVTSYRQQLRDLTSTIENILEFDLTDDALWPSKPEVYFEV